VCTIKVDGGSTIPLEGWSVGFALSLSFAPLGLKTRFSVVFSSAEEGACIDISQL
jgi:hypothetical protein